MNEDSKPALMSDASFWGMTGTQFLGAFNDNLFKQLILLLAIRVSDRDLQPLAMAVFSLPFLLFSGYAGFLSDRHSKQRVIVLCKVAEIAVMSLGVFAFLNFSRFGFTGLLVILFLMGTQSAFFGPGKYGILPELLRPRDLSQANGAILMTTFLAIIFGTATAGELSDWAVAGAVGAEATKLWMASAVCVAIAVAGTLTSLLVRHVPPANRDLAFHPAALALTRDARRMLAGDPTLLTALLASCVFWLIAGVTQQAVNNFGKLQLELTDAETSRLPAAIGVGIAVGAVVAGKVSRGEADFRVMRWGAWGMVAGLLIMGLPGTNHGHLWGYPGSIVPLVVLGAAAGMFAIPLQVFLQQRPPESFKGRVIAVMNQANFAAILLSAGTFWILDRVLLIGGWSRHYLFTASALIVLPVALFYRGPRRVPGQRH